MLTYICDTVSEDSLFDGCSQDQLAEVDVAASFARYCSLYESALCQIWPNALVNIRQVDTRSSDGPDHDGTYSDEMAIMDAADTIFQNGDWVVYVSNEDYDYS